MSSTSSSYIGTLPDRFSVDSDGGTNYVIPIEAPPGIAKMMPKLSVGYNSGGNGLLGVGWRLLGLSAITRVKATPAQDGFHGTVNFDANDRFALDGQRLAPAEGGPYNVPGASYHTEIESWHKVVPQYGSGGAANGPQSFLVYSREGNLLEFGTAGNAAVPASNDPTKIRIWALNKVTDPNGNYLTVTYDLDSNDNANYPTSIDYTANDLAGVTAQRSVKFGYESRTDSVPQYQGGGVSTMSRRLQTIQTFLDGNLVRTYTFSYAYGKATGRSQLQSITLSDAQGLTLPATTFGWQDSDPGIFSAAGSTTNTGTNYQGYYYAMDVNGDGYVDLVNVYENANKVQVTVFLSDGTGFSSAGIVGAVTNVPFYSGAQIIPIDVNGDGCMDLVYAFKNGNYLGLTVFTAQPTDQGWTLAPGPLNGGCPSNVPYGNLYAMDVDGDGLSDLVCVTSSNNILKLTTLFSDGSTFSPSATDQTAPTKPFYAGAQVQGLDFNGDGMMDLLYAYPQGTSTAFVLYQSNGRNGFAELPSSPLSAGTVTPHGTLLVSDLNGDGLDDVVQAYLSNGQLVIQPLMSNGRSLEIQSAQSFNIPNLGTALPTLLPMEVNGDGLPDLVVAHGVNNQLSLNVLLSTGSGYVQPATINQPAQVPFANLLPMDFNGDGKTDLVVASRAQTLTLTPVPSNTQFPDLMTTITNGLGGSYSITYKPLTDATVYSKGGDGVEESVEARGVFSTAVSGVSYQISSTFSSTAATAGASYATRRVRFPKYVAAAYTKSDGRGGAYTYQQFYTGALVDLTGRGWLGYESVSTSDLSTGTTTLVAYNQLFPLSHFTSSSTLMKSATDSAAALLLLKTSLGYDPVENGPNTGPGIYQARQTSMQTDFYTYAPLDSSTPDCSFVKTFSNFDAYGNAQLIAHTGNALAAELYVSKTYENDPTRWRIGYEVSSKATADSGGMQVLSWTQATYLLNMSVHTSSLWHDQTKQFLTTTYGYDQFGNRTSIHSPNGRVTNMVFEPAYHTYLQQKTEVVGSKSLVSSFAYYPERGELQSHTDENNVTFSQQLDGLGRVIGKTGPNPSGATVQFMTRTWETDETGVYEQVNRLVDWKGTTTWGKKYLDGFSRICRTSSLGPDGVRAVLVDQSFNSSNQVVQRSLPYYEGSTPSYTQIYFDEYKRTIRLQEPSPVDDGSTVVTTIDYQNTNHVAVTQASGTQQALETTYDYAYCNGKQLVTKRTDAMQACTTYAYDGLGRLTSVVDPGGVSSVTAYDTVGRPASFASYNKSIVLWQKNYSYDDVNGKETFQDAKGNMIVIQKDTLGRPVSKTATAVDVPGTGTTTFVFDSEQSSNSQGRISSASMPDGSTYTYQYDAYGNQTSISLSVAGHNWTVQQSYGPTKELQTRTHPDGSVETHVCTSGGEVSEIDLAENAQAPASRLISFDDFTSLGKPQTITYANGVSATLSFGTIGQLKAQTVTGPGATPVYSGIFEKNALGLLSTATDPLSQSQEVFDYDGVGRLAGVTGGTTGRSYQYDLAGNITLKDGIQYVSAGNEVGTGTQNGGTVLQATFDRNGNIAQATRNGATNTYLYDAENRLASAGTTSFSYDYSGRRLKKQVSGGPTVYSVAPYYQVAIFPDNSQQHTKLICGDTGALVSVTSVDAGSPPAYKGMAAPGVFYNHQDRLGSVVRQTDAQGKLVGSIDYDPFGAVSGSSQLVSVPAMFTGKVWDDSTGLYYFGARYYDPVLGRFLTPDDRTGGPMGSRDAFHPYAYCTNDPVNYVDPFGHSIGSFFESANQDVSSFAGTQGGHLLHDLDQLRYNRTFELVTSFVVDGALIIGGGVALFFGFGTLGSALMGAGITGLIYDVKVAATGQSFSWKDWGEQLAIGGLTGLVAGGIAAGAALAADTIAEAGSSAVNCAFEIGAAGRITLNVVAGALGGGAGNVAGQVLANEFSDDFTGQNVTAGLGYAALSGVVLGGVGTAIGEGTTRALSHVPDWDSATEAQLDKYSDRLWTRADDFRVTGRDLPFQRELDATPRNKVLVFLPGYVANWAAFGLTLTQTFKPSWFPSW